LRRPFFGRRQAGRLAFSRSLQALLLGGPGNVVLQFPRVFSPEPETWRGLRTTCEEDHPASRWTRRSGQACRVQNGPGLNGKEELTIDRALEEYNSAVLAAWSRSYSTSGRYLRDKKSQQVVLSTVIVRGDTRSQNPERVVPSAVEEPPRSKRAGPGGFRSSVASLVSAAHQSTKQFLSAVLGRKTGNKSCPAAHPPAPERISPRCSAHSPGQRDPKTKETHAEGPGRGAKRCGFGTTTRILATPVQRSQRPPNVSYAHRTAQTPPSASNTTQCNNGQRTARQQGRLPEVSCPDRSISRRAS
jgi:hypothetical protein